MQSEGGYVYFLYRICSIFMHHMLCSLIKNKLDFGSIVTVCGVQYIHFNTLVDDKYCMASVLESKKPLVGLCIYCVFRVPHAQSEHLKCQVTL